MDHEKTSRMLANLAAHHERSAHPGETCNVADAIRDHARHYGALADRGTGRGRGPAQVATDDYRAHYDTIFGKRATVGEA